MPRLFTFVSTRLSEPTSRASVCISPRPLCTCSSRSATCLKLSPSRCSSVACSFSSTVARICSSLASLPCCNWVSRPSTAWRTSARRSALDSLSAFSCSVNVTDRRCSASLVAAAWRCSAASCASRAASPWAASWLPACASAATTCCCSVASWVRKVSICSFWVRATSPLWASSVCWKVASVPCSSVRLARALSCSSERRSRAACSAWMRWASAAACTAWRTGSVAAAGSTRRLASHITVTRPSMFNRPRPTRAGSNQSVIAALSQAGRAAHADGACGVAAAGPVAGRSSGVRPGPAPRR
jgi:hypothetical protein